MEPTVSDPGVDESHSSSGRVAKLPHLGRAAFDQEKIRDLLRVRLRFIGLGVSVLWAFVTFLWVSSLLQPTAQLVSPLWMARDGIVFVVAAAFTAILWTKLPLSLRQLRGIEIALFGVLLGNQTWDLAD